MLFLSRITVQICGFSLRKKVSVCWYRFRISAVIVSFTDHLTQEECLTACMESSGQEDRKNNVCLFIDLFVCFYSLKPLDTRTKNWIQTPLSWWFQLWPWQIPLAHVCKTTLVFYLKSCVSFTNKKKTELLFVLWKKKKKVFLETTRTFWTWGECCNC